jgi:hypothetical protein
MKLGRNDPCHCGSGEKYKKCHLEKDDAENAAKLAAESAKRREAAEAAEAEAQEKAKAGGAPVVVAREKDAVTPARPNAKKTGTAPPLFRRRSV